jgi:hypothetical protein
MKFTLFSAFFLIVSHVQCLILSLNGFEKDPVVLSSIQNFVTGVSENFSSIYHCASYYKFQSHYCLENLASLPREFVQMYYAESYDPVLSESEFELRIEKIIKEYAKNVKSKIEATAVYCNLGEKMPASTQEYLDVSEYEREINEINEEDEKEKNSDPLYSNFFVRSFRNCVWYFKSLPPGVFIVCAVLFVIIVMFLVFYSMGKYYDYQRHLEENDLESNSSSNNNTGPEEPFFTILNESAPQQQSNTYSSSFGLPAYSLRPPIQFPNHSSARYPDLNLEIL